MSTEQSQVYMMNITITQENQVCCSKIDTNLDGKYVWEPHKQKLSAGTT